MAANKPSQYNTVWIKQLLSEIEIRKGYTLAQLVQDFYDTVVDTWPFHTKDEYDWYPRIEAECLPFFIFQKVYKEDITAENVSMEKIAAVLRKLGVEEQIKSKWKSDIVLIQKDGYEFQNRLMDHYGTDGLQNSVLHIPAFLLPVCQYLEMKKPELCCQVLNEYVFPAFAQKRGMTSVPDIPALAMP